MLASLRPHTSRRGEILLIITHILVLAGSLILVLMITDDCLRNESFLRDPRYIHAQFWICMLFIADIAIGFFFSPRKLRYVLENVFYLLICIPWLNIIHHYGIPVPDRWQFLIRLLPMVRSALVFAVVVSTLTDNRVSSLLSAYLALLAMVVYFSSVMFFVEEHAVNPEVHSFRDSIYWCVMNMTTTGSQITEYTPVGKCLAVLLPAMGLILFPVFTVYIANAVSPSQSKA